MHIGLILPGSPPDSLAAQFPDYGVMCEQWLQLDSEPALTFTSFDVTRSQLPASANDCDGWIILGSAHSTYEALPWIAALEQFIRACGEAGKPMVGICFGHQLIAQAYGGSVERSEKGWGIGVHHYQWEATNKRLSSAMPETIALRVSHQDQVVTLGECSEVLASSAFCPIAMAMHDNIALGFQGHPEFSANYALALLQSRSGITIDKQTVERAIPSLELPVHNTLMARIARDFLASKP